MPKESADTAPVIANALRARRAALLLTQGDAAQAAGVSVATWQKAESGRPMEYQPRTKKAIARALQWPDDALDRLVAGEDPATFEHERRQRLGDDVGEVLRREQAAARSGRSVVELEDDEVEALERILAKIRRDRGQG